MQSFNGNRQHISLIRAADTKQKVLTYAHTVQPRINIHNSIQLNSSDTYKGTVQTQYLIYTEA